MREQDLVRSTPEPRTRTSVATDLRRLGLAAGDVVIVHTSLSSLGWVAGGPVAVVQALMDVVTTDGTLVMPVQSRSYTDPANWGAPPVPPGWVAIIRAEMPAFDPALAPSEGMGAVAETFRRWPGAVRSAHPSVSFAAWGEDADAIVAGHTFDDGLGEGSPLARIEERNGKILLLGVGYNRNTSFHLAEYRVVDPDQPRIKGGAAILRDGKRVWATSVDIDVDHGSFPEIGAAFEKTGQVRVGMVGSAEARLMPQPAAVAFARAWLLHERRGDDVETRTDRPMTSGV